MEPKNDDLQQFVGCQMEFNHDDLTLVGLVETIIYQSSGVPARASWFPQVLKTTFSWVALKRSYGSWEEANAINHYDFMPAACRATTETDGCMTIKWDGDRRWIILRPADHAGNIDQNAVSNLEVRIAS